ncbi:MAG: hypothetical protein ACP5T2_03630 [Thermoprotei archaeon]
MENSENFQPLAIFTGNAKIGQVMGGVQALTLTPQDLSSPTSLQMALTRIMDSIAKLSTSEPQKKWVADIRFTDGMGNQVSFAVDLGPMPPLEAKEYKARIIVELLKDEPPALEGTR